MAKNLSAQNANLQLTFTRTNAWGLEANSATLKLDIEDSVLVDDEMEENDYLIGFELDVDKLVYAEILVNWPMKVLCKEDCEGICNVCGANLNKGDCGCQRTELDPRMAAIQDIFSKFKEV